MTGIAKIKSINLPSIAEGGQKLTLVVIFENVGDETDQFWVSADEYEGREGEYTLEYGGGTPLFNKRVEGYYAENQIATFQQPLTMPHKTEWHLRVYIGHYSDAAKTLTVIDDWKDLTIAQNLRIPYPPELEPYGFHWQQGSVEKTWCDGIHG